MEKTIYLADDQKAYSICFIDQFNKMGHSCWMLPILVCSLESIILVAFIYRNIYDVHIVYSRTSARQL